LASLEDGPVFELIPAIDVLGGNVVRLERGDYEAVTVYGSDPVAMARTFLGAGAPIVHVVDLEGARAGTSDATLRRAFGDGGVRFQIGGGLRTVADVTAAIADGAERAIVGTTAIWDSAELERMIAAVGPASLIVAVDVANGKARGAGWLDEGRPLDALLRDLVAVGVERILLTAIARDGMMRGPDLELLEQAVASGLAVIASGGVGSLADLVAIAGMEANGVIVGRAIYENRFTLAEAMAAVS
jgi:phosphoribosylformimino-5-aminoimidazole carboxamide ribotide isomerase